MAAVVKCGTYWNARTYFLLGEDSPSVSFGSSVTQIETGSDFSEFELLEIWVDCVKLWHVLFVCIEMLVSCTGCFADVMFSHGLR